MLAVGDDRTSGNTAVASASPKQRPRAPAPASSQDFSANLVNIATPVSFSGFTSGTLEHFAADLKKLGLEPRQGISSGGNLPPKLGNPARLRPGDMISVQLLSGDLSIGAEGTVTEVDGQRIYAFGHQFMSVGNTELPFARAEVLALLPNLASVIQNFLGASNGWAPSRRIAAPPSPAKLGRKAETVPVAITVKDGRRNPMSYHMQMVQDRVLSPFIVQMAVYSAIEATERTLGLASYSLRGAIEFQPAAVPPLRLDNTYAGDFNVPQLASIGVASPLASLMSAGFRRAQDQGH